MTGRKWGAAMEKRAPPVVLVWPWPLEYEFKNLDVNQGIHDGLAPQHARLSRLGVMPDRAADVHPDGDREHSVDRSQIRYVLADRNLIHGVGECGGRTAVGGDQYACAGADQAPGERILPAH